MESNDKYALIGAGPCGLAMIRCLKKAGIPFQAFEFHSDVGGIWNQENPMSTMYDSAHLISSKKMTEYKEFPFDDTIPDFPSQRVLKNYFKDFAKHFDLYSSIRFNSEIIKIDRNSDGTWKVLYRDRLSKEEFNEDYKGVILATGLFNKGNENYPKWEGIDQFKGSIIHSSDYRSNDVFANKDVLIVGCGNSAADIAIDAIHRAKSVDMSVRRGYYFVPKYIFGKPMDTINSTFQKIIPGKIKRQIDKRILNWFAGDPVRFGFPKPEYDLFESHPVINSYLLQHLGHGDIKIVKDISHLDQNKVYFKDGSSKHYDVILTATGYHIKFPYIDKKYLNWNKACPDLHLNVFSPEYDNLFVLGMIEATGIGWQGRYDQAQLVANYIKCRDSEVKSADFMAFEAERKANNTDLRAGMKYIQLDRMSYYVHKEHYMNLVSERNQKLGAH
jgi:cation diffusion facilitator CzcD-associated flavoprotein CzcO